MVIENDPSARMQVRSMGELMHPASCSVCGSGNCEKGYLDLGVFYDYEGQVYLCMICATQAGETIGLYTPDEVKQNVDLINELAAENAKLKEELNDYRPIIDKLTDVFGIKLVDPSDPASINAYEVPEQVVEESSNDSEGSAVGEPITEESVKVSTATGTRRVKSRDASII